MQERLRVVERREHAGDLFRDGGDVLVVRPLGGKTRDADLERAPRLEHLVAREAVKRGEETQRLAAERRRAVGDEGAGAMPGLEDANRGERTQTGANAWPADTQLDGQLALGGQTIAGAQFAPLDQAAHMLHHDFCGDAVGGFHGSRPFDVRGKTTITPKEMSDPSK